MNQFRLRSLILAMVFASVLFAFAGLYQPGDRGARLSLTLAIGCGLLAAGFVTLVVGALILTMRPDSAWARRVLIFGGITMASASPAMVVIMLFPL